MAMKRTVFLLLLCIGFYGNSQSKIWSLDVAKDAFISQLEDGKLLVKDGSQITNINHKTGEILWQKKIATKSDPEFLDPLPLMLFEGKPYAIIDATNGYIIDQSARKTTVLDTSFFWNEGRMVLELNQDDQLRILNINLKNPTKSWNTIVGPVQKRSLGTKARASKMPPYLTKDGALIIVDEKYVSVLNKEGNVVKRLEFNKKITREGFNVENNILYLLEDKKKLHFIDIESGSQFFKKVEDKDIHLKVLGNGSSIAIVQEEELQILNAITGELNASSSFTKEINSTYLDKLTGKLLLITDIELAEINPATAEVVNRAFYGKSIKEIYSVFGKTIVRGHNWMSPIDIYTLRLEYAILPDISRPSDYVEMGDLTGYIYNNEFSYRFYVVDKRGNVLWKKSFTSLNPPSIDVIGDGVLMFYDNDIKYLSAFDGKSIWHDDVNIDNSFTYGVDDETNDMFMYSKKRLYKFDYSNGTLSKSQDKFKFKDFDYELQQPQLFVMKDAIFLKGSNTIFVLNKDGTLKHSKSYKRIGTGSTILELAGLIVTAVAIGTGNGDEIISVYTSNGDFYEGSLVAPLDATWDIAQQMKYERRIKQNRSSTVFPYVFTKLESGKTGFIFLNPSTGAERFSITLDEKNPTYIVDDVDGLLFHLSKGELMAYDLN